LSALFSEFLVRHDLGPVLDATVNERIRFDTICVVALHTFNVERHVIGTSDVQLSAARAAFSVNQIREHARKRGRGAPVRVPGVPCEYIAKTCLNHLGNEPGNHFESASIPGRDQNPIPIGEWS